LLFLFETTTRLDDRIVKLDAEIRRCAKKNDVGVDGLLDKTILPQLD
jgi:hypothetical protein